MKEQKVEIIEGKKVEIIEAIKSGNSWRNKKVGNNRRGKGGILNKTNYDKIKMVIFIANQSKSVENLPLLLHVKRTCVLHQAFPNTIGVF